MINDYLGGVYYDYMFFSLRKNRLPIILKLMTLGEGHNINRYGVSRYRLTRKDKSALTCS